MITVTANNGSLLPFVDFLSYLIYAGSLWPFAFERPDNSDNVDYDENYDNVDYDENYDNVII